MLGMYVHTHWAYNHPYAARTWTLEDWKGYLEGLSSLGYDFVLIWPQLDCMPAEPNESDRAFLAKIGMAIDFAHESLGMKAGITVSPNTIGTEKAASYNFEERPYFLCEERINPKDKDAVQAFMEGRGRQFEPLKNADMLVMIDSDPGGYIGSTNEEFVDLLKGHIDILRESNPNLEFYYWMWTGWETYNRFWEDVANGKKAEFCFDVQCYIDTLSLIKNKIAEPWGVFCSDWAKPGHLEATEKVALVDKRLFNAYNVIEREPTFPLTNYYPKLLWEYFNKYSAEAFPRGLMGNSQTHCLQLPNAYLLSHYAKGGTPETTDLAGFAEKVLPGYGEKVAGAWQAIECGDPDSQRSAAVEIRAGVGEKYPAGECSGMLFGSSDRFLSDLATNLEIRADLGNLKTAFDSKGNIVKALRKLLEHMRPYQKTHGFVDAYGGPMYKELNSRVATLDDPEINAILKQFGEWKDPIVRHGVVLRLMNALEDYCRGLENK